MPANAVVPRCGTVALVGGEPARLRSRASELAEQGWRVRVLASDVNDVPSALRVPHAYGDGPSERSDRVRMMLQCEQFDRVEFSSLRGLGFRAVQAKRAGLAFADSTLAVRLDDTSDRVRRRERRWPDDVEQLEADFVERYAFENACEQVTPDGDVLEFVREAGWRVDAGRNEEENSRTESSSLVTVCVPYFNLPGTLPRTLDSLARQSYQALDVVVIDDGSTQPEARRVFDEMRGRFSRFRFLRQDNAGIGATRNRGLREARGEFFVPLDADNVARPDMIERFVAAMHHRSDVAALTCYFLAFATDADLDAGRFQYAYRPAGGPHLLACLRNVYGDATAIYRTAVFRAVGGYETDRGTSFEDWEAFVKLAHAGHALDVVPDHLFYYRHLPTGFSRVTDPFANHDRVVRQFRRLKALPPGDREAIWDLLTGLHLRLERLEAKQHSRRYRLVDRLHAAARWLLPKQGLRG